jgi:hypothetical protein
MVDVVLACEHPSIGDGLAFSAIMILAAVVAWRCL